MRFSSSILLAFHIVAACGFGLNLDSQTRARIFEHHGRSMITEYIDKTLPNNSSQPHISSPPTGNRNRNRKEKVGIIGAGIGGLYSAIILQSLNIPFEIIEASDRIGGRIFTYKFEKGGKYDYYDIGAMRYPLPPHDFKGTYQPGVMQRVGQLFTYLNMNHLLIPYFFQSAKKPGFNFFNGVRARIGDSNDFRAAALGINASYISAGVTDLVDDSINPFAWALYEDLVYHTSVGWEAMMKSDIYSTRAYLSLAYVPSPGLGVGSDHLSTRVINWMETFDKSTGWYDGALTESVLEALAFGEVGDGQVEWKCIDGGSHLLPDIARSFLIKNSGDVFIMNATVTSIRLQNPDEASSPMLVVAGGKTRKYSHVISTLPLPVLRTIDLTQAKLDVIQSNALRKLQYGPSVKIAILFSEPWWTTGKDIDGEPFNIVGGQSYTDLPIRRVVYPSYGANSEQPSNTLIASYSWTDDAERMGSLIGTGKKTVEDQLKHLVLHNLAAVHNTTFEYLNEKFVDMHSWDWNHQPLAMGAFAFFGPGDYQDVYTSLNRPAADGKLHFAGEALSVRHAWVVGALDSAWRAVYTYLLETDESKIPRFFELWDKNAEWFEEDPSSDEDHDHHSESGPRSASLLEKFVRMGHGGETT